VKLGGTAVRYHVNFYGAMLDGINEGDESDRFILQWDIASPRVESAVAGAVGAPSRAELLALGAEPAVVLEDDGSPSLVATSSPVRLVPLPDDIVAMRGSDPALAQRWREVVRAALGPVVAAGGRAVSLTAEGDYVVEVGWMRIESVVAHEVAPPLRPFHLVRCRARAARPAARGHDRPGVAARVRRPENPPTATSSTRPRCSCCAIPVPRVLGRIRRRGGACAHHGAVI
jgi:hypothetical protein